MRRGRWTQALGLALSLAGSAAMAGAGPRFTFEAVSAPSDFGSLSSLIGFTPSGGLAGIWQGPDGQVAGVVTANGTSTGRLLLPDGFSVADFDETHGVVGQWQGRAWRIGQGVSEPIAGLPVDRASHASATNASGMVVGWLEDAGGQHSRVFAAAPGQGLRTFGAVEGNAFPWDINDRGEAVYGTYGQGQFRVDTASGQVTPFAQDYAYGINRAIINERGDVAVDAGWRYEDRVAVFGRDGSRVDLATPPELPFADLRDFNDRGQILLEAFTGGPGIPFESRALLYTPGETAFDLLGGFDAPQGWSDLAFTALSDRGDVLGRGNFLGEASAFVLHRVATPVPEPSSATLVLLGLLGIGTMTRRRAGA